ncbi:MAG TPA: FtsX-like permease family protein [Trebonia sp.]|jgi:putative ABC transport system permease protein|nr:FtsX-like permease family protein [Trebonia sp.]
MSTALHERPAQRQTGDGGINARRAVIRWAIRLLRREWKQQLLILTLITVAVGATVVASTVATDSQGPAAGILGTAQDAATVTGSQAQVNAKIQDLERHYGKVDVIENESVQVPGTVAAFDLRSQDPHGQYGGPMLSLLSGQYPATASEIAVTSGVAADFHLSTGKSWTVNGATYKVTGIVSNPENLLDAFALVLPGQVTRPDTATVLFDAPGQSAYSLQNSTGLPVSTAQTIANSNLINPETISITAAVLGMLLIALVGVGGFTVIAQRRLKAIGMLAAQGATGRHIRLVVRANGAATGVVGAVAGAVLGFVVWLIYRPQAETSADHVMGVFQVPWAVIGISMALAVIGTYFAASRPAKAIASTPIVAALAGRPPALKKTRHLAIPIGIGFLVMAFLLFGAAGAAGNGGGGSGNSPLLEVAVGFIALAIAIVLLSPACLAVVAKAGKRAPIATRLALRDLSRYRARSGPALAAISLATLIAVLVCIIAAARYGDVLDYVGPNLSGNELVVHMTGNQGPGSVSKNGPNGPGQNSSPPVSLAQAQQVADKIAADLGTTNMITLEQASANLNHAAAGRSWDGPIYVATPQLLHAFGISQSEINPDADVLTMRPGMSAESQMQLLYGGGGENPGPGGPGGNASQLPCDPGSCLANPPIQEIGQLPSGTSAPNTVFTQHAITTLGLGSSITTTSWLITTPNNLTPAQITTAQQFAAAASGMSVETRNSTPSISQIIDVATFFGIFLALGILGMSVGLVRSEAARDLRTLTATGANGRTRRTITAATAGALAFTGAVIGIVGGYIAAFGFFSDNSRDGLSELNSIPLSNLLFILIGMPLLAVILGWLLAGRDPAGIGRQPLE